MPHNDIPIGRIGRLDADARRALNIWQQSFSVRAYETRSGKGLSLTSLCNYLQETASRHAQSLGVSVDRLLDDGRTWVLSRMAVKLDAVPAWQEDIHVLTWPSGARKLFALRDFCVLDTNRRVIGAGISAWLVIDVNSRRPIRLDHYLDRLNVKCHEHALSADLEKLPGLDAWDAVQRFRVRHHDLDINRHVNNVKTIEWALEAVPVAVQHACLPVELEVNFLGEAFAGEEVVSRCVNVAPAPGTYAHSIAGSGTEREVLRARSVWRPVGSA